MVSSLFREHPWLSMMVVPSRRISNVASTPVEFGVIPHDHWYQPEWIDEAKAAAARQKMVDDYVIHGGELSPSSKSLSCHIYLTFYRERLVSQYVSLQLRLLLPTTAASEV